MLHKQCYFSCISLNQADLKTIEVLFQNEFGQFLLINVLMVWSILCGFLFQQDHSCFDSIQSSKEEVFCFLIVSPTCFHAFLSLQLPIDHLLFNLQNVFYENLNRLKEISISFKRKYFNWVTTKSSFRPHFYLKNISLLNTMNQTMNNHLYFLILNLKILDFQNHSNSTRENFYCFNILLFEVILWSDLTQNKALNQKKLQLIHCFQALYFIKHLQKIKIEHLFAFFIFQLPFYQFDFYS